MARKLEDGAIELMRDEEMDDVLDDAPLASSTEEEAKEAPLVRTEAPETPEGEAAEEEASVAAGERDLTRSPDFRRYQSKRDKEIERLRRELEAQRSAQIDAELQRAQATVEELLRRAEEEENPEQRRALLHQAAQHQAFVHYRQYQRWEAWKRSRIKEAGLDPDDPRFDREYRSAEEFERDLLRVELEELRRQARQARRQGANAPAGASARRREVVDTGEPSGGGYDLERDMEAFNTGRMSPSEFARRWGRRK